MLTDHLRSAIAFQPPELLINRFCRDHQLSEQDALETFEQTKQFLVLCAANKNVRYSPSEKIDLMWHQFILHTRDYFAFCDKLGSFVHHQPSEEKHPHNYETTKRDLENFFGTINNAYWGDKTSDCDGNDCTTNDCTTNDCCPIVT